MSKGYCDHSCKHFKYENVYETFEEKNSNGEVIMRWQEYKSRKTPFSINKLYTNTINLKTKRTLYNYTTMDRLVTIQMAKQLKNLGMKFELPISYDGDKVYHHHLEPTIHQVRDWFLNENGIFIRVDVSTDSDSTNNCNFGFFFDICKRGEYNWEIIGYGDDWYDTYDEALFAGIEYALGNVNVLGEKKAHW